MTATTPLTREVAVAPSNPLGIEGIEFIEYTTPRPQALGQVLESLGFRPVARHRSREVLRYVQGDMNIIVNSHGLPPGTSEVPQIAAVALRVRHASEAWRRAVDLGAWPVSVSIEPMELHIPGVHGVGVSRLYFIDRWREFSIYDVDFIPIPTVQKEVASTAGLHWFGVVQYIGFGRSDDWCEFYRSLFGFTVLPAERRFGILPGGAILASPCGTFFFQLVEPAPDAEDTEDERLQRVAFGAPRVADAVTALNARGVNFVEAPELHTETHGALTAAMLGGLMFELVQHTR